MKTFLLAAVLLLGTSFGALADPVYKPIKNQNTTALDFLGVSLSMTSALGAQTTVVSVHCTEDCWVAFAEGGSKSDEGGTVVAERATSIFIPADTTQFMAVARGVTPFAIRAGGSNGILYLQEYSK